MQSYDSIQPTRSINFMLKMIGLWSYKNSKWFPLYRFYSYSIHLTLCALLTIMMNIYLLGANDLKDFLESIFMTFTMNAMLVKVFNIIYYGEKVKKLLEHFQDSKFQIQNDEELAIIKSSHKGFNRFKIFYNILCLSVLTTAYLNGLISRKMPYVAWFPIDWRENEIKFYYAYFYETTAMTLSCLSNLNLDLFQTYILFQTGIYYELIAMRLRKIGYERYPMRGILMNAEDEAVAKDNLIQTMKAHQLLVKISVEVETIISVPVAFQNLLSAAVICLTAYELVSVSLLDNTFEFLSLLYFLVTMAVQIFLPCYYGHLIIVNSSDLTDAMYSSNWVDFSTNMRKLIYIYMECLKKPIKINAAGIFVIGLGVFTKTMNNSYSLFAVLMSLEKKQ